MALLTQEALDMLDAGICLITFTHPRYAMVTFWFTDPRHPGELPLPGEDT